MDKEKILAAYEAADHYEKTRLTELARQYLRENLGREVGRSTLNYYRKSGDGVGTKSKQHALFTAAYAAAIQKQNNGTTQSN